MPDQKYENIIRESGLRVTPQRVEVLRAVHEIKGHPTSEEISRYVKELHPSVALGTVYHILDSFVDRGILSRVKTEKGAMLYDETLVKHHHLYCNESERIEDYYDEELDDLLEAYFRKKNINNFEISDIKLHLVGKFRDNSSQL